jgi:hypothetical protein
MIRKLRPQMTDELIGLYCDWRTRCEEVHSAYERFAQAPRADRAVAFAAFQAALDREECAADAYAAHAAHAAHAGRLAAAA